MSFRSIVIGLAAATFAVSAGLVAVPAAAAEPLPGVVPSVREATAGGGSGFTWSAGGRIVVANGSLTADARTFASDLAGLFGEAVPPVVTGAAQPGDISLSLGSTDTRLGEEGYGLSIGPVLAVSARTTTGAFWGTRTVLQLLRQQRSLPAYTIADWPKFKVRAISVSVEKFPAGWFLNLVRDMSYVKLNELTTGSALSMLSDTQIREIQTVADRYHVKFVGWFNTTHYNPGTVPTDFQLRVQKSQTDPTVAKSSSTLDITKPAAVTWATNQISRYMELQTAPFWHAGGDEYPMWFLRNDKVTAANTPDLYSVARSRFPAETYPAAALYNELFNQVDALARSRGKQLRIWNDDLVPTSAAAALSSDVVVDHWINYGPALDPAQLVAAGHHLINSNQDFLYYDENDGDGAKNTTPAKLWMDLDPGVFHGGLQIPGGAANPNLDGIKLNTWHGAHHKPPGLLELDLLALNRPLAERAWAPSPPTSTIAVAQALFARIGRAPGVVQTPLTGDPGATSLPGSPAVSYLGSQQVFFVGANGQLRRRYWKAGQTSVVEAVVATSLPVAGRPVAYVAGSQLHVFARGTNGSVQHAWYEPSTNVWAHDDWTARTGAPAVVGDPGGFAYGSNQHVFFRGADGMLRRFYYDVGSRQLHAESWGGSLVGDPVAFVFGRTQNVFAVGPDGGLHRWWWQPSDAGHIQHQNLGGSFPSSARPAGAGFAENVQDVVVRGTDGHLWHWSYDELAGTSTWRDLTTTTGLSAAGNPALYTYGVYPNADRHIFVRNADNNHLAHLTLRANGTVVADDWTTLALGDPETATSDPAGFTFANTERHAFATDSAGRMHHWYWLAGDGKVHQDNWPA